MNSAGYVVQSLLITAWWIGLAVSDVFFQAFQYPGIPPIAFLSFCLPDFILIVALSCVYCFWRRRELQWMIWGAVFYATLFCISATCLTGGGLLATSLMVLAAGYNGFLCFPDRCFAVSSTASAFRNGWKTLIQVFVIWSLTLIVMPSVILMSFQQSLFPIPGWQSYWAIAMFVGFSAFGLWSAAVMVTAGLGTPLPLDQPTRLVTIGPYRWVRNPMAIAGIGQGFAVALLYLSWPILVYGLIGAVVWNYVIRPFEESDLEARFGDDYRQYRQRVGCWLPRRTKFHI